MNSLKPIFLFDNKNYITFEKTQEIDQSANVFCWEQILELMCSSYTESRRLKRYV